MKYVSQGPLLVDVHMHRPHTNSRNFMDSLLAFWPGLQVMANKFTLPKYCVVFCLNHASLKISVTGLKR